MKRRHLVVLVSAITLVTIIFVAFVMVGVGVGTDPGREQIRAFVESQLAGRVQGKVHLGRIRVGLFGGVVIDSFAIRDTDDSLLVSLAKVTANYDWRDLADRRILLRNVVVERPVVRFREYETGDWNWQRTFKRDRPSIPGLPGRSLGDYIVLDSVRVRNGQFILVRPWAPADSLSGARRDSAIRVNLASKTREIRRVGPDRFTHVYRWTRGNAFLPHMRIADPDTAGQLFHISSLDIDEQEPPFKFRNARGHVRKLGDTISFAADKFDLPASTGSLQGRVWWGGPLPVRVDVRVKADSVSLNDIAWVYETLPRVGGGRTDLRITNNPRNMRDFQYALTNLDVRSTRSHLTGSMTFALGEPVLAVRDVDLRGSPINFDLVRTLSGEPLPVDWQGDLYGVVRGPGGPLTHFVIDTSFVTFRDAHVRGAISQGSGRGALNILYPDSTEFRGFDVHAVSLDLRSIEFLFPSFPRIGGTVSGVARLDSSWLDVRFSNADVTHRNGPGEPTRVTGSGRVTYGDLMLFDVALQARPLSLTAMSRAYPLGLKGVMSGPILAKGTSNDMQVTANLDGPAGRFTYTGRVDLYPLSVAARGSGRVESLDLAAIVDKPNTPAGFISGAYQVDVRADTNDIGTLTGAAAVQLERSELDGIRVFPSRVRARFADRRMYVDTLRVESVAATITAAGALGLTRGETDSLQYLVTVDSLGGLRRYVTRLTSALRTPAAATVDASTDSLAGAITVLGAVTGSLESLTVAGSVTGTNVYVYRQSGRDITGSFSLSDVLRAPTGAVALRFNALSVGGIVIDTLGADLRLDAARSGTFRLGALTRNRVTLQAAGDVALADSRMGVLLRSVALTTDSSRWTLETPATLTRYESGAATIDSLVMSNGRGGRVAMAGVVPDSGSARVILRADSVPLRDVGQLAQFRSPMAGWSRLTILGSGTKASPVMNIRGELRDVRYGAIRLERVTANADYASRRAQVALDLASGGRTAFVARGSLPVELTYFAGQLLEDSLTATIRTDSASFSLVEALVPGLSGVTGRLIANLDIAGTWKHLDVTGPLRVEDGEMTVDSLGIRVRGVQVDLGFFGHRDSLAVRRIVGFSGEGPNDSVSLRGHVAYRDIDNPYVDLRAHARAFHAFDKRSKARLYVSTEGASGMRLRGQLRGATLTGGLIVDRGVIFLPDPELLRKRLDFASVVLDTVVASGNGSESFAKLFESVLFDGVRITLGDEVWLRSAEANIKLGGVLNVQQRAKRASIVTAGLVEDDSTLVPVLDGELRAERGTYTLDLGKVFQREFQVEGGTVTFFGTADLEPTLDISALHTVRKSDGASIRIRVRLTGSLSTPIIALESAESYALSQSDLVSYLIFGQPNFELGGGRQGYVQLAAQTLLPTATAGAASALRGVLGPAADILHLRPAAEIRPGGQTTAFTDVFWTSQIGGEKQISENLFVSVSTGLCQFQGGQQQNGPMSYVEGLSGKLEYRLSRNSSVKLGKEPAASTCRGASAGRVVPAPSQWGLSVFKTWRF